MAGLGKRIVFRVYDVSIEIDIRKKVFIDFKDTLKVSKVI